MRLRSPRSCLQLDIADNDEFAPDGAAGCQQRRLVAFQPGGGQPVDLAARQAMRGQCGIDRRDHLRRRHAFAAADAGDDHGFTHDHCVTGIAGRHPCIEPTGEARDTAMRTSSPPSLA